MGRCDAALHNLSGIFRRKAVRGMVGLLCPIGITRLDKLDAAPVDDLKTAT